MSAAASAYGFFKNCDKRKHSEFSSGDVQNERLILFQEIDLDSRQKTLQIHRKKRPNKV